MTKKGDKVWIPVVVICDVLFLLAFIGILSGLWKINWEASRMDVMMFFLQIAAAILNFAGIQSILYYEYPDGTCVLPVSQQVREKFGKLVFPCILFGTVIYTQIARSIDFTQEYYRRFCLVTMVPGLLYIMAFLVLLFCGIHQLMKKRRELL